MSKQAGVKAVSGNLNGVTAGTAVNGTTLRLGDMQRYYGQKLSALVSTTLPTATITVTFKWQVSNGGSVWYDVLNGTQNAAAVVFSTGTATIKNGVLVFPEELWGWEYARIVLVTGVATGAAGDLYSMAYYLTAARNAHQVPG